MEKQDGIAWGIITAYFFFPLTDSLKPFPGRNRATFEAAIVISLPVCGFRPFRFARFATEKEPNPVKEIEPPLLNNALISFNVVSMTLPVIAWLVLVFLATFEIRSALVIAPP